MSFHALRGLLVLNGPFFKGGGAPPRCLREPGRFREMTLRTIRDGKSRAVIWPVPEDPPRHHSHSEQIQPRRAPALFPLTVVADAAHASGYW